MAKKKSSNNNDQSELPLGGDDTPVNAKPETGNLKPEVSETSGPKSQISGLSGVAAATEAPPPKRKKGEKVQDDPAPLAQSYRNWFLDYASYVILDRAVPHIDDGLKPVQRR
ncbi:DNA topoisomerase, partial [bacterium]|nr:DNA topoisomerase [bacterium]